MSRERGASLIECLVVLAAIGTTLGVATPAWMNLRRRAAVRAAAGEIASVLRLTRSRAIARNGYAGVKFIAGRGDWQYALYDDGDGDGVRNDDIARGVDRRVGIVRQLWQQPSIVRIALPPFVRRNPDGDRITASTSPVQFNSSTICSFSPSGQSTPGTLYLWDGARSAWAARVFGTTARVRLLRYDEGTGRWVKP